MMTEKKYKDIEKRLVEIEFDFFNDTLFGIKNKLAYLEKHYSDYTRLRVLELDDYYDRRHVLLGTRSETDKERDARLVKARKARDKRAEKEAAVTETERQEFLRLREKFGNLP